MSDVIDLSKRRKELREAVEKEEQEGGVLKCPECGDTLFMVVIVPDYEDERAVICQHCTEPVAIAYEFEPEDDEPLE